ncbi:uncharacterized protein plekhg6 [Genypterus blacodes]|uniref:uncharacterized protein plekhg6 n=1 Tax=Genypterus blacodes TaxID=154954 RepID=UPI003F76901C
MDPTKPSFSSKAPSINSGGGNESSMDETALQWRDGAEGERQRDTDGKESEVVDGTTSNADSIIHQRGSADKQKFGTSGYQRRTRQKVVTDFATASKGASVGAKPRAALRQVLFSQGVSDKNAAAEEQLDVLKQTLEAFAVPISLRWRWKEESQGTTLEKNWTDIVHSHSTMSKTQRHQQEALWEFVHTELTYINKLMIIKDLVIAALINVHQQGFLLEISPELLFSNLRSIISAHQLFWQEVIYPMLQEVRRTGKPFDPLRLEAGCLQFPERFASYLRYCWEEENTLEFTRRGTESNPHLQVYVRWVETHPMCERMRIGDMQAKPHQRITKYPLLLKAVLKNSQDPHVQQTVKGMLSTVNDFLESINDYLRLKDEELALSISAQRVEGYEVEGINEEIDKFVREICQFDLTCPIRGVGTEVIRKLLLEENLKIRGRKDSKLEVVALLFSDVLLMTKVQKKGERLKVVRPPLALDRTFCIPLKDGCSFVLVEVGELWCAMNVYIFATSTSDSCARWVSTILHAQKTLRELRDTEKKTQLQNRKIQQLEAEPVLEANVEKSQHPHRQSREETFVDKLKEEPISPLLINGMLMSKAPEPQYEPPHEVTTNNTKPSIWPNRSTDNQHKLLLKGLNRQQQAVQEVEWIEMGVREQRRTHREEEEAGTQYTAEGRQERRVTWNSQVQSQSVPNLYANSTGELSVDPLRHQDNGPHVLLLGGYPDIDYPINQSDTFPLPNGGYQSAAPWVMPEFQTVTNEGGRSSRTDSDSLPTNQESRRNGRLEEEEPVPEAWGFSRHLRSPGLRRRRLVNSHQGPSAQIPKQGIVGSGLARSTSNTNSSSNSDSDSNHKRNSTSSIQSSDSPRVLRTVKSNQAILWNMPDDRASPDPVTLSDPEPPEYDNRHGKKTQRSQQGLKASSLEGLLERAKGRVRDRDGVKTGRIVTMPGRQPRNWHPPPSFPNTPSLSHSDGVMGNEGGELETDWEEEEVELMRRRALRVSQGWKEQLVDGDEDEDKKGSLVFSDGVNVDWPGWCFDDEEVIDHINPADYGLRDEGLLEGISRTLTFWDFNRIADQDDGECSQV